MSSYSAFYSASACQIWSKSVICGGLMTSYRLLISPKRPNTTSGIVSLAVTVFRRSQSTVSENHSSLCDFDQITVIGDMLVGISSFCDFCMCHLGYRLLAYKLQYFLHFTKKCSKAVFDLSKKQWGSWAPAGFLCGVGAQMEAPKARGSRRRKGRGVGCGEGVSPFPAD